MTKLPALRTQLTRLFRLRRSARLATAWCSVALAALWCVAALYLIDWTFELTRLQRVVAIAASVGVVVWAYRKYAVPWLVQHETLTDVALLVERQHKIDSDLVAALQFESPQAATWGSPQLEEAVIDYVADFSKGMNLLEGFNRDQMVRRGSAALATLVVLVLAALIFPRHAGTFLSRLFLSSAHYPTNTSIEQVFVNGKEVNVTPGYEESANCAYGRPLRFQIVCGGELPEDGRATLRTSGGLVSEVAFTRAPAESPQQEGKQPGEAQKLATYTGELPRLVDSLDYQLYFGDAWTEAAEIHVIPLPKVEFTLKPTPPKYARGLAESASESSARQFAVIEGSSVGLEVTSDKPLEYARLKIDDSAWPLVPLGAEETSAEASQASKLHRYTLQTEGTPLARVTKPIAYQIEALDTDGLSPAQPIQGFIRIRNDRAPRIFGNVATRQVLPGAKPSVSYNANDDFGINAIRLHVQVTRKGQELSGDRVIEIRKAGKPVFGEKLPLEGKYPLDLSKLKLLKGDQLTLTLEAIDYRGTAEGHSSTSEPLVLFVTDQSGIYADLSEIDERAARQFDAIIRLGIGDKP